MDLFVLPNESITKLKEIALEHTRIALKASNDYKNINIYKEQIKALREERDNILRG